MNHQPHDKQGSYNTNSIQLGEDWHEPETVFIGVCPPEIDKTRIISIVQDVLQSNDFVAQVNVAGDENAIELVFPHRLNDDATGVISPEHDHFVTSNGKVIIIRALKDVYEDAQMCANLREAKP